MKRGRLDSGWSTLGGSGEWTRYPRGRSGRRRKVRTVGGDKKCYDTRTKSGKFKKVM